MTTTPDQALYLAAEDAVEDHVSACGPCSTEAGDCAAGFALVQEMSMLWAVLEQTDPAFAAAYAQACIRQAA